MTETGPKPSFTEVAKEMGYNSRNFIIGSGKFVGGAAIGLLAGAGLAHFVARYDIPYNLAKKVVNHEDNFGFTTGALVGGLAAITGAVFVYTDQSINHGNNAYLLLPLVTNGIAFFSSWRNKAEDKIRLRTIEMQRKAKERQDLADLLQRPDAAELIISGNVNPDN